MSSTDDKILQLLEAQGKALAALQADVTVVKTDIATARTDIAAVRSDPIPRVRGRLIFPRLK
jgi:hypothetical protein